MQAQSRLGVKGGAGGFGSAAVDEAVVRELMRGHELTAQLQAEALRGQGQAEATTASILQEMSRTFTVCISTMGGSAPAATAPPDAAVALRANKDDGIPRKRSVTSSPHSDGHQWRKYGQKKIMGTSLPRCYYRCRYHRERSCPATKQVQQQQHGDGDPTMYLVTYIHEHTCHHTAPAEPEAPAARSALTDFSAGLSRQQRGCVSDIVLDRGAKEELEQQALVSSLVCVLQGRLCYSGDGTPEESSSQGCTGDGASASAVSLDASDVGLDVMDYDVTDTVYFGTSSTYGLPDVGMLL